MKTIYIAASGRVIPGGWPQDGRPINELNQFERNLVRDGDLIEAKPAKPPKKD
ncbi:hypothetical protein [Rhizobium sp. Root1203]|uniref:hypothetical protein n=1 Tax=Rhizobium sp. Root1203 TaxID=1736427 RepID=UPI000AC4FB25|nr:hypothetical protein [Rhizobium sp. Root1203]